MLNLGEDIKNIKKLNIASLKFIIVLSLPINKNYRSKSRVTAHFFASIICFPMKKN